MRIVSYAFALKYSDNIYFAKLVTQIGEAKFTKGMDAFGFNKQLPFAFPLAKSSYGDKMDDSIILAASGFGQGKLQVNPIHLTSMYSAFLNAGNMLQPTLSLEEKNSTFVFEKVISNTVANTMKEDLIVTGNKNMPVNGQVIGGKTGTAEVGNEQIGWTVAFREGGAQPMIVTVMIENAKAMNGSMYVTPIIQDIFTLIP